MALIVSGHARSGTSLLRRLCQSHPQVNLTREFGNFSHVGLSFPQYSLKILKRGYLIGNYRPINPLVKYRRRLAIATNVRFISRYLFDIAKNREGGVTVQDIDQSLQKIFPDSLIVGDKFPFYMAHLPKLSPLSGLNILAIYRDCRDVTSSFLEKVNEGWWDRKWNPDKDNAENIAARWVWLINIMESYADRIHIIRYEDLVRDPSTTMKSVGQWLNIDPQHFSLRQVQASSIGKYKKGLTSLELEGVMRIAGSTMARLGYL